MVWGWKGVATRVMVGPSRFLRRGHGTRAQWRRGSRHAQASARLTFILVTLPVSQLVMSWLNARAS